MGRKILQITPEALVCLLSHNGEHRLVMTGMPKDAKIVGVRHSLLTIVVDSEEFTETEGACYETFDVNITAFDPRSCLIAGHVRDGGHNSCACGAVKYKDDGSLVNPDDEKLVHVSQAFQSGVKEKIHGLAEHARAMVQQFAKDVSTTDWEALQTTVEAMTAKGIPLPTIYCGGDVGHWGEDEDKESNRFLCFDCREIFAQTTFCDEYQVQVNGQPKRVCKGCFKKRTSTAVLGTLPVSVLNGRPVYYIADAVYPEHPTKMLPDAKASITEQCAAIRRRLDGEKK